VYLSKVSISLKLLFAGSEFENGTSISLHASNTRVSISDFISSSVKSEIKEFQDYRQICWPAPNWSCFLLFRTKNDNYLHISLGKKFYIYKIVCNHLISCKTFLRISLVKCWNNLCRDLFTQFACWFLNNNYYFIQSLLLWVIQLKAISTVNLPS